MTWNESKHLSVSLHQVREKKDKIFLTGMELWKLFLNICSATCIVLYLQQALDQSHIDALHVSHTHVIFTVVKDIHLDGDVQDVQVQAINSWLSLKPIPEVVLVNSDISTRNHVKRFAKYPSRLQFQESVQLGFHRVPLFHSILRLTENLPRKTIVTLVNSDIFLCQCYWEAIKHVHKLFKRSNKGWVVTASRWDLPDIDFSKPCDLHNVEEHGELHTTGGVDIFSWLGGSKILQMRVPPFIWARSRIDNWLLRQIISENGYHVVDVTEVGFAIHKLHNGDHGLRNRSDAKASPWTEVCRSNWQVYLNSHLAFNYGSFHGWDGTSRHVPYKLVQCEEQGGLCLLRRVRPGQCACEYAVFSSKTNTEPVKIADRFICGIISDESAVNFQIDLTRAPFHDTSVNLEGFPHSFERLVDAVAANNIAVATSCNTIRDVPEVMETVCSLNSYGIHPIVMTADDACWLYLYKLSIGVYHCDLEHVINKETFWGRDAFRRMTMELMSSLSREGKGTSVLWVDAGDILFGTDQKAHSIQSVSQNHMSIVDGRSFVRNLRGSDVHLYTFSHKRGRFQFAHDAESDDLYQQLRIHERGKSSQDHVGQKRIPSERLYDNVSMICR